MIENIVKGSIKKPSRWAFFKRQPKLMKHKSPGKLNIPNSLSAIRLIGSLFLAILAYMDMRQAFFVLMIILLATDWLDGKLAIFLHQQTTFGARLDSIADTAMYSALLVGLLCLIPDFVYDEIVWVSLLCASFVLTITAGVIKFGRLPSYHTRLAKLSWLLTSLGVIVLFAGGSRWFARIAMGAVILTNFEATAITAILPEWRTNVLSLIHALRYRKKAHDSSAKNP